MTQTRRESRRHQINLTPLTKSMTDRSRWGGKAIGLAQIHGAGLNMPETHCVSCDDLPLALAADDQIEALDLDFGQLPAGISAALSGSGLVVRSSSTEEDGITTSGAGLYETVLGVRSLAQLKGAIKACWKVAANRPNATHAALGLVIQPLVPCEIAGVAFSKDPMGTRSGVCIEASWGNCSAIVDGRTDPDRLFVDGQSVTTDIGIKAIYDVVVGTETKSFDTPEDLRPISALRNEEALELATYVEQMDARIGTPVDIEWGISNGTVFLFQCRAITTL